MGIVERIVNGIASAGPTPWIGVIGSLGGVALTFLLTYYKASRDARLARREYNKRAAVVFCHRLINMITASQIIHDHFKGGLDLAKQRQGRPGLLTQPMNKIADEMAFSEDNIWAISQLAGSAGMNAFGALDGQFNTMIKGVEYFTKAKQDLEGLMPTPEILHQGDLLYGMSYQFDKKTAGNVLPRMEELDGLVVTLEDHSRKNKEAAIFALKTLLQSKRFPFPNAEYTFDDRLGSIPPLKAYKSWKRRVWIKLTLPIKRVVLAITFRRLLSKQ